MSRSRPPVTGARPQCDIRPAELNAVEAVQDRREPSTGDASCCNDDGEGAFERRRVMIAVPVEVAVDVPPTPGLLAPPELAAAQPDVARPEELVAHFRSPRSDCTDLVVK